MSDTEVTAVELEHACISEDLRSPALAATNSPALPSHKLRSSAPATSQPPLTGMLASPHLLSPALRRDVMEASALRWRSDDPSSSSASSMPSSNRLSSSVERTKWNNVATLCFSIDGCTTASRAQRSGTAMLASGQRQVRFSDSPQSSRRLGNALLGSVAGASAQASALDTPAVRRALAPALRTAAADQSTLFSPIPSSTSEPKLGRQAAWATGQAVSSYNGVSAGAASPSFRAVRDSKLRQLADAEAADTPASFSAHAGSRKLVPISCTAAASAAASRGTQGSSPPGAARLDVAQRGSPVSTACFDASQRGGVFLLSASPSTASPPGLLRFASDERSLRGGRMASKQSASSRDRSLQGEPLAMEPSVPGPMPMSTSAGSAGAGSADDGMDGEDGPKPTLPDALSRSPTDERPTMSSQLSVMPMRLPRAKEAIARSVLSTWLQDF